MDGILLNTKPILPNDIICS